MNRKVVFWLEPDQLSIPVDQIPGAVAESFFPPPDRNEKPGCALNDPLAVSRFIKEREVADLLRRSFSNLSATASISIEQTTSFVSSLHEELEVEVIRELVSKQRCNELAAMDEIRFEHWEELTGVGLGAGLYCRKLDGIYPEQYNENELLGLARTERITALEHTNSALLRFPCTPAELIKFVDDSVAGEFDLPQWFREAVARKADAEFTGTFNEVVSNGRSINWCYWMSMKALTASQSSRLMVGLDPDIFTNLDHNGPTRNDTSKQRGRARDIERLALNLGMTVSISVQ